MSEKQKEEKQRTPEFENCVANVMKQGHEKGSAMAICTTTFQKADKPLFIGESENQKLHLFSESIKVSGNKVSGVCIHPKRIFHPEEGLEHVYLKEELEKAAPTLVGKPFGIDHMYVLPPPNLVTNAWYDPTENGVAFEGTVDQEIAEQLSGKAFKGISIELNWLRPGGKVEFMNGVAPRNFELTSVHLLRRLPPGDKDAYIKFWNAIMEQLVQGPPITLDMRVRTLESRLDSIYSFIREELAKIQGVLAGLTKTAHIAEAAPGARGTLQEAEWDTAYINDLPDNAFAVIGSGGQKDDQGKTTPRTLRHLPHHKSDGSLDLPHLRNALARMNQIEGANQADAKKHLCGHAKDSQIVSEFCGEDPPKQGESEEVKTLKAKLTETETKLAEAQKDDIVAVRKQLVEAEAKLVDAEKKSKAAEKKTADFRRMTEAVLPAPGVYRAWSPGPRRMVQELQKVLLESSQGA